MGNALVATPSTSFKTGLCQTFRDGLKPVQRRILYSMNKDGNTFDKSYRKSAKSVGNIMGNFHPTGQFYL